MSGVVESLGAWWWPRAVALALLSVGLAACSGDLSRLHEGPFSSTGSPDATGSIAQSQAAPAQAESGPPATQQAGSARRTAASPARPSAKVGTDVASAPAPASARRATSGNWSWDGGTAITVARGDTLESIAKHHNVPASAIMEANNLSAPTAIRAGQRLVIPRHKQTQVASAMPGPIPAAAGTGPIVHVVASGETLGKISHRYGKSINEIAKANKIDPDGKLTLGDRLVIPGARTSAAGPAAVDTKPAVATGEPGPPESASMFASAAPTGKTVTSLAEGTGSLPTFRWPARGRVIAGYGPTPNGQQNDGINLALPEGTPVKAAEDGVVAYAGNELKGYGNLVLVRHASGYVTAYAHAKELLVKRGEQVKRGQTIAVSGQTGSVNAPQLHFEIRKGSSPLDPMRFLNGA